MRNSKLLIAVLLLVVAITSCIRLKRIELEVKPDTELNSYSHYRNGTVKEKMITEIWTSGFFEINDINQEEIINNIYGIFGNSYGLSSGPIRQACYIYLENHKDRVMLNTNLFSHSKINNESEVKLKPSDERIKASLVHELFHDFWYNILDKRKRILFSKEAEILFIESIMAQTKSEKLHFLHNIGLNKTLEDDFKLFEGLKKLKEHYPDQKFFGTELYSIIADKTFSRMMIIPRQLRKYYYGIISDNVLNNSKR
ncbi:MAG: hypothetical protein ACETWK_08920 [Candidatus Aminicenantaceae bacterium]